MPKNILIFSDGTGQIGGLRPDQRLSNIYKMYRAMRPGPDSEIPTTVQVAFYDPGLGSSDGPSMAYRRLANFLSSAFGTGISQNIVDCYEAIIKSYQPGDRIFLFGFSRGAYTARCVANTLNLCGVPRRMHDGSPVPRLGPAVRALAEEAVYHVYEHGSGKDRGLYEAEREEQARRFRARYDCEGSGLDGEAQGNVAPTFIGVFDTVAALGSVLVRRILGGILLVSLAGTAIAAASAAWFWAATAFLPSIVIFLALLGMVRRQFKFIVDGPSGKKFSWHFAAWNLNNYDRFLDTNVELARHALSVDENRARFPQVGWGKAADVQRMDGREPQWLDQVWFAGNHSDIGGSYPEEESRLSDIALAWMLEQLHLVTDPPAMNAAMLRTNPDALGLQHDEVKASRVEWFPGWWPRNLRFGWEAHTRKLNSAAKLHPTVIDRLAAPAVPQYDLIAPYRPSGLSAHETAGKFFDAGVP